MGLATTGWAEQQNVGFGQFDLVTPANRCGLTLILDSSVVVVHRHGEDLLSFDLTNDVIIKERANLSRVRQVVKAELGGFGELFFDDLVTEIYALVADVDTWTRNELFDLLLRLTAERAFQQFAGLTEFRHCCYPSRTCRLH